MKSVKQLSLRGMACLFMAATLPMACQSPGTQAPAGVTASTAGTTTLTASSNTSAAVTGIVYTAQASDGRLVPPERPLQVQILDEGKAVASVDTDSLGRFYLSNIPAPPEGKVYTVKVASAVEERKTLFPGRVLNLSSIKVAANTQSRQVRRITGILRTKSDTPLANVEVRDKSSTFRKTTTDQAGRFSLEIIGDELEIISGLVPITVTAEEFLRSSVVTIDTTNVRLVRGRITDKTNTSQTLGNMRVRVQGSSVSSLADAQGNFSLSGAPVEPFILEVEPPKGYAPFSIEIPPASFNSAQQPDAFTQNVALQPVGSVQINFIAETSPAFDRLPPIANPNYDSSQVESPPLICDDSYLNCFMFDLTGQNNPSRPEYENILAVEDPLKAFVSIEGSGVTQEVNYPPAPFRIIYGADPATGEPVRISDRARASNVVVSVKLDEIPGGRQSVTISMTGFQTQKSIPVYVPPNDTISTELITLYRVEPINSFGDVKGVLKGTQALPAGSQFRVVYLDLKEDLNYEPILGDRTNPNLLNSIRTALASNRGVYATTNDRGPDNQAGTADDAFVSHEFYLKNVPSGSRIMLAAVMVDASGSLSDCYIPNTSVLLNVRSSQINLAPDLELTRRPNETGCTP